MGSPGPPGDGSPTDDIVTDTDSLGDVLARRRDLVLAGHRGNVEAVRAAMISSDPDERAIALGALARAGALAADDVRHALGDPAAAVRRRAAEIAATLTDGRDRVDLVSALGDRDPFVAEAACWALGEWGDAAGPAAVRALGGVVTGPGAHDDPLVREAAVAALGAIGDAAGLDAILAACRDKPTIRRRAVLALAPFEGPEVEAALALAAGDRDWQVRQAAEDLST